MSSIYEDLCIGPQFHHAPSKTDGPGKGTTARARGRPSCWKTRLAGGAVGREHKPFSQRLRELSDLSNEGEGGKSPGEMALWLGSIPLLQRGSKFGSQHAHQVAHSCL